MKSIKDQIHTGMRKTRPRPKITIWYSCSTCRTCDRP
jgi:hypothetical protein